MQIPAKFATPTTLAVAALLCFAAAFGASRVIEARSSEAVRRALTEAGHSWITVEPNGLQIILTGTAPSEAKRFNALNIAAGQIDSSRLRDRMDVAAPAEIKLPDFSLEMLRNESGLSLIGLMPASTDRERMVNTLTGFLDGKGKVTDMLETASHPAPGGWDAAVDFALVAMKELPRAKISVAPGRVAIDAITDTPAEKTALQSRLRRMAPGAVTLTLNINAPHPVIAPFTLRLVGDGTALRFDACSADSEEARSRILAAAREAGMTDRTTCNIGLGVPTPEWADAVIMGIAALKEIGKGSVTFSDADVALIADAGVSQTIFDRAVGELESNLPEVFSLHAQLTPSATTGDQGPAEFSAMIAADGKVQLRGRVPDALTRDAADSFARASFGATDVYAATRLDPDLPQGWPIRVLAAIEALGELADGSVTVQPDRIAIKGLSGNADASDNIARILSSKLGETARFSIDVRYDKKLDPLAGLPTAKECVDRINQALTTQKITFEPGSATITRDAVPTLDRIAALMKNCAEFQMEVGGHTDSQGREEMNLKLSQDRAQAVIAALQSRRVLTGRLQAKGYGKADPVADNGTEAGREQNRRIEFTLTGADAAAVTASEAETDAAGPATAAPDATTTGGATAGAGTGAAPDAGAPDAAPDTARDAAPDDAAQAEGADGLSMDGMPMDGGDPGATAIDAAADEAAGTTADTGTTITVQTPDKKTVRPAKRPRRNGEPATEN